MQLEAAPGLQRSFLEQMQCSSFILNAQMI